MATSVRHGQPLRIGIVGARQHHQGVGSHVARHLAALGADVVAVAGTSDTTVAQACRDLQQWIGVLPRGYIGIEAMLRGEPLDAVAICSPDRFHRQHLAEALACRLHVLCEKPLVFESGRDPAADAAELIADFAAAKRLLMVNEQWPYTLPAFQALYPDADLSSPPERLAMRLSPSVAGAAMIPNAAPHLLSLVWRLCPAGGLLRSLRIDGPDESAMRIHFCYEHCQGHTEVALDLRQAVQQPRAAGYAIDGRGVRRVVEMPEYRQFFEPCGESLPTTTNSMSPQRLALKDPLQLLVADFLTRVERCRSTGAVWQDETLRERLAALREIAAAAERRLPGI